MSEALDELRDLQRGGGRNGAVTLLPTPQAPVRVAEALLAHRFRHAGEPTLHHWRGGWWRWVGSRWVEIELFGVRSDAYSFTATARYVDDKESTVPWNPTRHKVANLVDALAAITHLSERVSQPSWIDGRAEQPGPIVACANGLLRLQDRELLQHTPLFFNQTAVPFDYDPSAPPPQRWLAFLNELWGQDHEQIEALRQWFGYVVSGRLDLHKILLLVGPTRAGKGVIARTLGALIGSENVAGPTLSSLSGDFGLAPLLGKPLAVIADARLTGRDSSIVVERLLSISGEDTITVDRKHREQWTGKLPARFMVCSNELPRLGDASAAIAGRFVTLILERSWLGNEDTSLEKEMCGELPGILNWGLDGLAAVSSQGRFVVPSSTEEAFIALQDLASPVRAFIRDRCEIGTDLETPVDDLWRGWKQWADDNGHKAGSKQLLGRDVRAAVPRVRVVRPGGRGAQHRVYTGIRLREGDS